MCASDVTVLRLSTFVWRVSLVVEMLAHTCNNIYIYMHMSTHPTPSVWFIVCSCSCVQEHADVSARVMCLFFVCLYLSEEFRLLRKCSRTHTQQKKYVCICVHIPPTYTMQRTTAKWGTCCDTECAWTVTLLSDWVCACISIPIFACEIYT